MTRISDKTFHTYSVKRKILIKAERKKVWAKISHIAGLPTWVVDVKKTTYLSKKRRNVGTVRKITFTDNSTIEEHVVLWKEGEGFTYIATEGLPLRAYVATISIKSKNKKDTQVTWKSYFNSKKMSKKDFTNFVTFIGNFYKTSLKNLKKIIEK